VRVYQDNVWTLPKENATTVGMALRKLDPTYVSGLIRLSSSSSLSSDQISAYNTIRSLVLKVDPRAKFDLVLNALQYKTANDVTEQMRSIDSKIHIDAWFFDMYSNGYKLHPSMIEGAISYAHSHHQYIGGNVFGSVAAPGSDFVAVDDSNFNFNLKEIDALIKNYPNLPILAHLSNNPQNGRGSESCRFMNDLNEPQRAEVLTDQASGQSANGYEYMYGVYFPQCPISVSYDSSKDGAMFHTIQNLMAKYN
jgi:hypothetical protein